jgi:undecaprenyl-diphosphatase
MNGIDATIVHSLNAFANRSPIFDTLIGRILDLPSIKMLPMVAIIWALWFDARDRDFARKRVMQAFVGAFIALVVSQLIQAFGPFRPRPVFADGLGFVPPFNIAVERIRPTSSFPSDHAALAFALATGIFIVNRALGGLSFLLALLSDGLARIYAGFHFPSDVAAGALLGVAASWAVIRFLPMKRAQALLSQIEQRNPRLFYFVAFCFAYQIVSMLWDLRFGAGLLREAMHAIH